MSQMFKFRTRKEREAAEELQITELMTQVASDKMLLSPNISAEKIRTFNRQSFTQNDTLFEKMIKKINGGTQQHFSIPLLFQVGGYIPILYEVDQEHLRNRIYYSQYGGKRCYKPHNYKPFSSNILTGSKSLYDLGYSRPQFPTEMAVCDNKQCTFPRVNKIYPSMSLADFSRVLNPQQTHDMYGPRRPIGPREPVPFPFTYRTRKEREEAEQAKMAERRALSKSMLLTPNVSAANGLNSNKRRPTQHDSSFDMMLKKINSTSRQSVNQPRITDNDKTGRRRRGSIGLGNLGYPPAQNATSPRVRRAYDSTYPSISKTSLGIRPFRSGSPDHIYYRHRPISSDRFDELTNKNKIHTQFEPRGAGSHPRIGSHRTGSSGTKTYRSTFHGARSSTRRTAGG